MKFMHKAANSKRKRKRKRTWNRRMVHQKWQIKAAIKQQQSQIQNCPKLGTTNGGELFGEWYRHRRKAKRIRITYLRSEAKWLAKLSFCCCAASLLSTAREKTRETDCMRESALVFSLSGASIAVVVIAALYGIQTNSVCLCCAQRTLNSSSWLCKFQKQIVQLTGWAIVTAKATTTNNTKQCRAQAVHCTALQQGKGSLN